MAGRAEELPIALCGFMGVGKSALGRALAGALGRDFLDADELITERLGEPIAEYFAHRGEASFRALEEQVIAEALRRRPAVVLALGGGALVSRANRRLLLEEALLVHLDQSFEELAPELGALAPGRPLLAGRDESEVRSLYDQRRKLYLLAPLQVPTGREGLPVALARVLEALRAVGALRDEALP